MLCKAMFVCYSLCSMVILFCPVLDFLPRGLKLEKGDLKSGYCRFGVCWVWWSRVVLFILASFASFIVGSDNNGFHFTKLVWRWIVITSEGREVNLCNCQVVLSPNYKAFLETASPCLCKQTKTCLLWYMITCLSVCPPLSMCVPICSVCLPICLSIHLSYLPPFLLFLSPIIYQFFLSYLSISLSSNRSLPIS